MLIPNDKINNFFEKSFLFSEENNYNINFFFQKDKNSIKTSFIAKNNSYSFFYLIELEKDNLKISNINPFEKNLIEENEQIKKINENAYNFNNNILNEMSFENAIIPHSDIKEKEIIQIFIAMRTALEITDYTKMVKTIKEKNKYIENYSQKKNQKSYSKDFSTLQDNLDYAEYKKRIQSDIQKQNMHNRQLKQNIDYPQDNKIAKEIVETIGSGGYPLLIGDTGIGKTYTVNEIAQKYNIPIVTVNGNKNTDEIDFLGSHVLSTNSPLSDTSKVKTIFKDGFFTSAIKKAQNQVVFLLIDEIGKINDQTSIISLLGNSYNNEIKISTGQENWLLKLKHPDGNFWVKLSNVLTSKSARINKDGKIFLPNRKNILKIKNNNFNYIEEAANRGHLVELYAEDLYRLSDNVKEKFLNFVTEEHRYFEEVYCPKENLVVIGTANTGEKESQVDNLDPALLSRFYIIPVKKPSYKYMVQKIVDSISQTTSWTDSVKKEIVNKISFFLENIKKKIDIDENELFSKNPDYRTIERMVNFLDSVNPLDKNSTRNIYRSMERAINDLIAFDSSVSAEEYTDGIYKDTLLKLIEVFKKDKTKNKQRL